MIHPPASLDPNMSKRTVFDLGIGSMETLNRWLTCYHFVFVMARLKLRSHGGSPIESHYGHLQVKSDCQTYHHSSALERCQFLISYGAGMSYLEPSGNQIFL
jgi:hypothetical protein